MHLSFSLTAKTTGTKSAITSKFVQEHLPAAFSRGSIDLNHENVVPVEKHWNFKTSAPG
jgi:hypothetical protein